MHAGSATMHQNEDPTIQHSLGSYHFQGRRLHRKKASQSGKFLDLTFAKEAK